MGLMATIVVQNRDMPTGADIDVGFNGVNYKIQEGKVVEVPWGVLNNLRDAKIRVPKTDPSGNLMHDEVGQPIWDDFNRFHVTVIEEPGKKKIGRPTKDEQDLRKHQREQEAHAEKVERENLKKLETAEELEKDVIPGENYETAEEVIEEVEDDEEYELIEEE